jgi:hypothetical protein
MSALIPLWRQLTANFVEIIGGLSPLAAALMIVGGLAALFYGRRMAWVFTALMGFMLGMTVGPLMAGPVPAWLQQVLVLMIGVISGFLGLAAHRPASVVIGALAVAGIARFVATYGGLTSWLWWLLALAGVAIGALLMWRWRESMLIVISAFYGALAVTVGARVTVTRLPAYSEMVIFLVLVGAGIVWQAIAFRHEKEFVVPVAAGGLPPKPDKIS